MSLFARSPLAGFFLRGLLWLPVWFAVWYFTAPLLTAPVMWIVTLVMNSFHPQLIDSVERMGNLAVFVTGLQIPVPDAPAGALGQVILEKNPLIYSWNLPVLVALLFATDDRFFSWVYGFNG